MNAPNTSSSGTGAGIAAGVISLMAFPIGFVLFGLEGSRAEGLMQAVAEGWNEGGWWMYVIMLLEFVLMGGGALSLLFFARGKQTVWALTPAISVLMMAVAVMGFMSSMSSSMAAVMHANPLDRGIIMYAATGESLQTIHFALSFITATFVLHAVGLALIGFTASEKKPPLVLALGVFGLSIWLFASQRATSMELGAYKAMAHAAPSDRATIVIFSLADAQSSQKLALGAMLVVLVAVVLALVTLRSTPRALAGVVSALLVTLAGVGGLRALGRPNADGQKMMKGAQLTRPLLELRATPDEMPFPPFTLGSAIHDENGAVPTLEEVIRGREEVSLMLETDVTLDALRETLGRLASNDVKSVKLYGELRIKPPDDVKVPDLFEPLFHSTSSVRIGLINACPAKGCAQLNEKGLSFDGETWEFVESSNNIPVDDLARGVPVELKGLTLPKLLECAKALDAQGLPMMLVLGE
ncbi:MAG: hypothetical protein JNM17_39845 [Archangium sp.]|nr:hypothetical protein [Archangium sp.]